MWIELCVESYAAIFRSLLYEACGRIINPIYGSVGLLWSGNWAQCQAAVDSVLKGTSQLMQMPSSDLTTGPPRLAVPSLKYSCDIRHIKKSSVSTSRPKRAKLADPKPSLWIYPAPVYEETSRQENVSTEDEVEGNYSAETIEDSPVATASKGPKTEQIWKFDAPMARTAEADNRESTVGLELTLGLTCEWSGSPPTRSSSNFGAGKEWHETHILLKIRIIFTWLDFLCCLACISFTIIYSLFNPFISFHAVMFLGWSGLLCKWKVNIYNNEL